MNNVKQHSSGHKGGGKGSKAIRVSASNVKGNKKAKDKSEAIQHKHRMQENKVLGKAYKAIENKELREMKATIRTYQRITDRLTKETTKLKTEKENILKTQNDKIESKKKEVGQGEQKESESKDKKMPQPKEPLPDIGQVKTMIKDAISQKQQVQAAKILPTNGANIPQLAQPVHPSYNNSNNLNSIGYNNAYNSYTPNPPTALNAFDNVKRVLTNLPIDRSQFMGFTGNIMNSIGDAMMYSTTGNPIQYASGALSRALGYGMGMFQNFQNRDREMTIKEQGTLQNRYLHAKAMEQAKKQEYKDDRRLEKVHATQNELAYQQTRFLNLTQQGQHYDLFTQRLSQENKVNLARWQQYALEAEANHTKALNSSRWEQNMHEYKMRAKEQEVSSEKIFKHQQQQYAEMVHQREEQAAKASGGFVHYYHNQLKDASILNKKHDVKMLQQWLLSEGSRKKMKQLSTIAAMKEHQVAPSEIISANTCVNDLLVKSGSKGITSFHQMRMQSVAPSIYYMPGRIAKQIQREEANKEWWQKGRDFVEGVAKGVVSIVKNSEALKELPVVGKVIGGIQSLVNSNVAQYTGIKSLCKFCKDNIDYLPDVAKCIVDGCAMADGVSLNYHNLQQGSEETLKMYRSKIEEGMMNQLGPMGHKHGKSLEALTKMECNSDFLDGLRQVSKGLREGVVKCKNLLPRWAEEEKLSNPGLDLSLRREELRSDAIQQWNDMFHGMYVKLQKLCEGYLDGMKNHIDQETDPLKKQSLFTIAHKIREDYRTQNMRLTTLQSQIQQLKDYGYDKPQELDEIVSVFQEMTRDHKMFTTDISEEQKLIAKIEEFHQLVDSQPYVLSGVKQEYKDFLKEFKKYHSLDDWVPRLKQSEKLLYKIGQAQMSPMDRLNNPNKPEVDYALSKPRLTAAQKKEDKEHAIKGNPYTEDIQVLYNILTGQVNDADEVFDKKNLPKNDWRRVLYNFYVVKDPLTVQMLESAGLYKKKQIPDKDPKTQQQRTDSSGKPLFKEGYEIHPLKVIPDRFEQIRNYVVLHAADFPNQNLNDVAQSYINQFLFASEEDFEKRIVQPTKKIQLAYGITDVTQNMKNIAMIWNNWTSHKKMTDAEFKEWYDIHQATKDGSFKRLADFLYKLYDPKGKNECPKGMSIKDCIRNEEWLQQDLLRNHILESLMQVMDATGFGSYVDTYKIMNSKAIRDVLWMNGKCILCPNFYQTDSPLEQAKLFKQAQERVKLFAATYINELSINRVLVTNSVFQGELGLDNSNPLIDNMIKEKEDRRMLVDQNWLNGGKRDSRMRVARASKVTYKPKFEFKPQDWDIWRIGQVEYDDPQKKKDWLKNQLSKLCSDKGVDGMKIFEDVVQTMKDDGIALPFVEANEKSRLQGLQDIQRLDSLADLIINNGVKQLNEWSVDLRDLTHRGLDVILKSRRVSKEEYKKLTMEQKVAYYNEHPNYYHGLDSFQNEWTLDDEQVAVDILLLNRKEGGDLLEKEYYKKANDEVKRFLRRYANTNDLDVSDEYIGFVPTPDRYKRWYDEEPDIKNDKDWNNKYPNYNNWRHLNGLGGIPHEVCKKKYLQHLNQPLLLPHPTTLQDYVKKASDIRKQIKLNKTIPRYEDYMSKNAKNGNPTNPPPNLPVNHRLQWNMFGKKGIPVDCIDTPEETMYQLAKKKMANWLMKNYPKAKGVFNNIKNISLLTFDDFNRLIKVFEENPSNDNNYYYALGEKYNTKINDRISERYGQAVAVLQDLKANYPNQLDERTSKWISKLRPDKLSIIVASNLHKILANRDDRNLMQLSNILYEELDCHEVCSDKAYPHKFDVFSLYSKPEGYSEELDYEEYPKPVTDQDKPRFGGIAGFIMKHTPKWICPEYVPTEEEEVEHTHGKDIITVIKNDEHELTYKSKETGLTYTVLKKSKPKIKRMIKMDNELVPKGECKVNEWENGVLGDLTQVRYQLNDLEIVKEVKEVKKTPEQIKREEELKNQNKSMEFCDWRHNVMQEDAWEHSKEQKAQLGYNQAANMIQANTSMHENSQNPL
jgi:hypothetical protein